MAYGKLIDKVAKIGELLEDTPVNPKEIKSIFKELKGEIKEKDFRRTTVLDDSFDSTLPR